MKMLVECEKSRILSLIEHQERFCQAVGEVRQGGTYFHHLQVGQTGE